jgi:uncharacterized protein
MTFINWPLLLAAVAMGLAAAPHCALMCGGACTALTHRRRQHALWFHVGRVLGYSVAGAVAASSVAAMGAWAQQSPALRPLWTLLHLGLLGLGLWWLMTGQQPAWMRRREAVHTDTATLHFQRPGARLPSMRAGGAGLAWVAWPCAALQAALLLAVLAPSALGGALVMATFALASLPGLLAAPWAWSRWQAWRGQSLSPAAMSSLGLRVGGAALVLSSAWVLTHGLWQRVAAWCLT